MVDLMINTPDSIQKQIVDCLELISMTDFPTEWPSILPVNILEVKKPTIID